jgi:hypothetical protein
VCALPPREKKLFAMEKKFVCICSCVRWRKKLFIYFFLFFMGPMIPVESTRLFRFVGIHGLRGGSDSEECVARALGKVS